MAMVQQATRDYFLESHPAYQQPDVLGMQWQFSRLLFPAPAKLVLQDMHLGKAASTVFAVVSQGGAKCMMGFVK